MEKQLVDNSVTGIVRLGTTIALGTKLMPLLAKSIESQNAGCKIKVNIANAKTIESMLLSNSIDLGFIEGPVFNADLKSKFLAEDFIVPIAPPNTTNTNMTLQDFAKYPLLFRQNGSITRSITESVFLKNDITPNPLWESESSQAIINAVHEGIGVSVLPQFLVSTALNVGAVKEIKITNAVFKRKSHIVWHKDKYISPFLSSIMESATDITLCS